MTLSSSTIQESASHHRTYSRKQKSLGLLCSNFLSLYNRDGVEPIGLDDAASRLGVERRRIYDIVNVLESVGVLARKAKNQYSWKGFGAIPKALEELREEGLRENFHTFDSNNSAKVGFTVIFSLFQISDDEDERFSNPNTGNNRREKSLGLLTQNFVKLFLCSNVDLISLEEAARILLGDGQNSSIMRTKVRRLYDIANVLSSMNLIEKTNQTENRKPAFRWLGMRGKSENGSFSVLNLNESKKRTFGTEITNISLKRNKMASSVEGNSNQNTKMQWQMQVKHESLENGIERSDVEKGPKQSSKSYQFGPFAPVSVQDTVRQVRDWESLASTYRPQYHSQALRDLFAHYMEAWKTWYSEVAGKEPIQIS
ncbi:E2F transcription factor-like E2FE [Vitis vinifera]|uniref:E2F transcription factor-like E2FE n=1 Tax=Vitis vinifera TaxID=29760 RepID=A0A438KBJ8_VITVI|nr:E2F transcription factor-like E2FE [Vitis vinifera]